jgi:hypothetical protein
MWKSLGYITGTPGATTPITQNETDPTKMLLCHAIFFQQVRTNTGFILCGQAGLNEATGVGLNAVLAIPTDNSLPNATVGIPDSGNPLNAAEYVISPTVGSDKCLVSILVL